MEDPERLHGTLVHGDATFQVIITNFKILNTQVTDRCIAAQRRHLLEGGVAVQIAMVDFLRVELYALIAVRNEPIRIGRLCDPLAGFPRLI